LRRGKPVAREGGRVTEDEDAAREPQAEEEPVIPPELEHKSGEPQVHEHPSYRERADERDGEEEEA